ncbi:MAG: hypothetical protein U0T07_09445 [Chitinophagales bacterium]
MIKKFQLLIFTVASLILLSFTIGDNNYDASLVEISTTTYNSDKFIMVNMKRDGNHIKAKYFAATDPYTNKNVTERFNSWSVGKNIVSYSSGTYMTACEPSNNPKPVGLCIDNGEIVNKSLTNDLGGLVIVYATGGVVATRLNDGNLTVQTNSGNKMYDIKNNTFDRVEFINWARDNEATVFQAHLLVYKNNLDMSRCKSGNCLKLASRRFLAVCKDQNDKVVHTIIHCTTETTLYDGAVKSFNFLKEFKDMKEIVFMINLDTGCQNVFKVKKSDGTEKIIKNTPNSPFLDVSAAVNLLVYYFE